MGSCPAAQAFVFSGFNSAISSLAPLWHTKASGGIWVQEQARDFGNVHSSKTIEDHRDNPTIYKMNH